MSAGGVQCGDVFRADHVENFLRKFRKTASTGCIFQPVINTARAPVRASDEAQESFEQARAADAKEAERLRAGKVKLLKRNSRDADDLGVFLQNFV